MEEVKDQLRAIREKQDEHTELLAKMDKTIALQQQQLEYHIKRTDLAEQNLELLRAEFTPVKKIADFLTASVKIIAIIASGAAATYYITQVIKIWFKL